MEHHHFEALPLCVCVCVVRWSPSLALTNYGVNVHAGQAIRRPGKMSLTSVGQREMPASGVSLLWSAASHGLPSYSAARLGLNWCVNARQPFSLPFAHAPFSLKTNIGWCTARALTVFWTSKERERERSGFLFSDQLWYWHCSTVNCGPHCRKSELLKFPSFKPQDGGVADAEIMVSFAENPELFLFKGWTRWDYSFSCSTCQEFCLSF